MNTDNLKQTQERVINNINDIMKENMVILNDYNKSKRFNKLLIISLLLINMMLFGYIWNISNFNNLSNQKIDLDKQIFTRLEEFQNKLIITNSKILELEFKAELILKGLHESNYLDGAYERLCWVYINEPHVRTCGKNEIPGKVRCKHHLLGSDYCRDYKYLTRSQNVHSSYSN